MANQAAAIVIDNGTLTTRAGFASSGSPQSVFPTVIGKPRRPIMGGEERKETVGREAMEQQVKSILHFPVQHGNIIEWENAQKIWQHIFSKELKVDPTEHRILMAAPFNEGQDKQGDESRRDRMTQIMFESHKVPAFYVASQPVLSLYATGRSTGVTVESGEGVTQVVPIHEGRALQKSASRIEIGGIDLTIFLAKVLREQGYEFGTPRELREIVRDIKEKHCFVSQDFDQDLTDSASNPEKYAVSYELPDGNKISIGSERFRIPEALFMPSCIGSDVPGIHRQVGESVVASEVGTAVKNQMCSNVVLAGGPLMCKGFSERLQRSAVDFAPPSAKIVVTSHKDPLNAAWIGGSMLASHSSMSTSSQMWVTKQDYDETGASVWQRKCLN